MYTQKLESLAREIANTKDHAFPFEDMTTWYAGYNEETGEYYIADNGEEAFADPRIDVFVKNFPHIAIEDLNVTFDNDEKQVIAAIEKATS